MVFIKLNSKKLHLIESKLMVNKLCISRIKIRNIPPLNSIDQALVSFLIGLSLNLFVANL